MVGIYVALFILVAAGTIEQGLAGTLKTVFLEITKMVFFVRVLLRTLNHKQYVNSCGTSLLALTAAN